jgi:hypothetical protein
MMSYHTSATTAATFSLGTIEDRGGGWWNRWSIPFSYGTIYPSSSSSSYHQFMFEYHTEMMTGMRSVHPKRRTYLPTRTIHQVMPSYGMRNDTFH